MRASRDGHRLILEVEDNGVGLPVTRNLIEGVGLTNTRERLRASFADEATLSLESADGGGTVARIDMPFRAMPVT